MAVSDLAERVASLADQDRLRDAAELAEAGGLFQRAAELWERDCDFPRAARAWIASGQTVRGVLLAARGRDRETENLGLDAVATDPEAARRCAADLRAGGFAASAARLFERLNEFGQAASCYEAEGSLLDAARCHVSAADPRGAARAYEALLKREPQRHDVRLLLAELLQQHGKWSASVRLLQEIPASTPERARALPPLKRALVRLAVREAAAELDEEMRQLGVEEHEAPSAAEPPERLLFGRYKVIRDVATTPTARVYEAFDQLLNERVAVKVFSATTLRDTGRDALHRFEREARLLGELRHPSIVPLLAYQPLGPAVVLRWMDGGSLADVFKQGSISPARAAEISGAVLSALAEAHRRGVLHRDIKPANVLFDAAGRPHLADFGTAHVSDSAATVTAGIIGTLAYMAPEQRAGAPANVRSDVYGAGALLWHGLTGAPPAGDRVEFLSRALEPQHRAIARRLIAEEAQRPEDTIAARELLTSVAWPAAVPEGRALTSVERTPAPAEDSLRLRSLGGARYFDTLLEREILVLEADAELLMRVAAFARANHPALPAILAYQPEQRTLFIEAGGEPLERALMEDELAELGEALAALHRAGASHGAVDSYHVVERGGRAALRFRVSAGAGSEADLAGLQELANPRPAQDVHQGRDPAPRA